MEIYLLLCGLCMGFGIVGPFFWYEVRQKKSLHAKLEDAEKLIARAEVNHEFYASQERKLHEQQSHILGLIEENSRLKTLLSAKEAQFETVQKAYQENEKHLREAFKALSAEALSQNNASFLKLAESALSKFQDHAQVDLGHRQKAIQELVNPIKEALQGVDKKVHELEKVRVGAYETLKHQVQDLISTQKELKTETLNLVQALRAPQVRGRWGEIQLKRVVEMAGMVAHCDFTEQVVEGEEKHRPDMIVHLPGGKNIIVDAKAPLHGYLEALDAKDMPTKHAKLTQHAKHVRQHIIKLSAKGYWDTFKSTPEFVVLFLPGETFFSAALEQDPSLIELGAEHKVILATPTTLIALLRAVSYGWRQEALAKNAKEISDLGRELHKRIYDMGGHFARVGKHLSATVESYNQTLGTFERRVMVSARKFEALDVNRDDVQIEQGESVEKLVRTLEVDVN